MNGGGEEANTGELTIKGLGREDFVSFTKRRGVNSKKVHQRNEGTHRQRRGGQRKEEKIKKKPGSTGG